MILSTNKIPNETVSRLTRWPTVSGPALIIATVFWVCIVANQTLWSEVLDRLEPLSLSSIGYMLTLLSLMVLLLAIPLIVIGQHWILKPLLIIVLLSSATLAYFTQHLGVIYGVEMVRNIIETVRDRNTQEASELLSSSLIYYIFVTTFIPITIVVFTRIRFKSALKEQILRLVYCLGLALLASTLVLVNFKYLTYFSRENNDLEVYLNPLYTIKSTSKLVQRHRKSTASVFNVLGNDAIQAKTNKRRVVGVMVVGETARSDHFGLNGYARATTPKLSKRNIINYSSATSCGTSTAYSVPCMFSFMDQDTYTPERAREQSNVLDVLTTAGVDTVWVDSNSSCKGVCARIESVNILQSSLKILQSPDADSSLFVGGAWHDEKLLEYLDVYLDRTENDVLLVLHTMGSHGPAYYRRYPPEHNKFTPFCQSKAPQDCSNELITNAYDNTIAYTDHFLDSIIEKLESRGDSSFMLYASDHGESLGENGIYLHGLPRFLAPKAQTSVPVIAWFSDDYKLYKEWPNLPEGVVQKSHAINHDNLSASLLGLYSINSSLYKEELDLFRFRGQ